MHAGDTLSPSLMSGIDRGEHIMTLTNMIAPDIFVPGNHEFDFGKEIFFERMAEAKFPLFCANILNRRRHARRRACASAPSSTFDGIRIGIAAATDEEAVILSSPGDLKFPRAVDNDREAGGGLAQGRRRYRGRRAFIPGAPRTRRCIALHAADIILSGHDHDLWLNYDGRTAAIESSYDAHFVTCIDVTFTVRTKEGRREVLWHPEFRIDRHPQRHARSGDRCGRERLREQGCRRQLDVVIATTAVELDSRNPTVRTQEAAIGNLIADAMRAGTDADIAITNGGGIRGGRIYPPGSTHHAARHHGGTAVPQSHRAARNFRPRDPAGPGKRLQPAAAARPDASRKYPG